MSKFHVNVPVASRFENDQRFSCDATVMADDDKRVCLVLSSGCATTHCRMTPAEARALGLTLLAVANAVSPDDIVEAA